MVETLRSAIRRIRAPAAQVCREMNVGVCDWTVRASRDSSLNAGARPNGLIVVNRGIVEYAANEEEVCMVIAHEMGHQAANHIATGQRNQSDRRPGRSRSSWCRRRHRIGGSYGSADRHPVRA